MYIIVCMFILAIVTYIPRVIPLIINKKIESIYIKSVLHYMPYCVLGAMTFPGVFYSTSNFYYSIIGASIGIILAYMGQSLIKVAMISVLTVYGMNILF